jgi:serine/threonine protein phosphatase PrpC
MIEIITGFFQNSGQNNALDECVLAGRIDTAGGLELDLAVLSELITSEGKHLQLPQLAVDSIIAYIQQSPDKNVAAVLYRAAQHANQIVHRETKDKQSDVACSLIVAAVHNGQTLYIANIGGSRAYLVRKTKITQLKIEHTFARMMPVQGKIGLEAAFSSKEAGNLVLSVGPKDQVPIDIGFHSFDTFDKDSYLSAQDRGRQGLPLEPGDAIVLTANFLNLLDESVITPQAIFEILSDNTGDDAAEAIAFSAEKKQPGLVPAVALLQTDALPLAPADNLKPIGILSRPAFIISSIAVLIFLFCSIILFLGLRYMQLTG